MRTLLQSETYQRSSKPVPGNETDTRFYSRYYPKRLMAEVMLDAISQVTGSPTKFASYPEGWRAVQLPDSNVDSYFLKSFGRPDRDKTCECERTTEASVSQVLHLANGDTMNKKLASPTNRLESLLSKNLSTEKLVEELHLIALSRMPTTEESARLVKVLEASGGKELRPAIEDLVWAVVTSKEFLFNH